MLDLVIVGAGGLAREVLAVVEAIKEDAATWNVLGMLADDDADRSLLHKRGVDVIGTSADIAHINADYVVGIGSPRARARFDTQLQAHHRLCPVLQHPTARIASEVELGGGCVLAAQSLLTTNIRVGRHVHLNIAASVSHDGTLGSYTTLAPGVRLAGNVTTEEGVDIGIGAVCKPGVVLGAWSVVGAGAAVVSDVPAGVVVAGVPARELRRSGA
jgi:sugar O-acyltransferase (sialic acid O-acetyltransferase NeuD family)